MALWAPDTLHAPSGRLDELELQKQVQLLANNPFLTEAFNHVNVIIIIANQHRQIIFANETFNRLLEIQSNQAILGKRPGEALNCIHSGETLGGCGTSESCRYCGAVDLILKSISDQSENSGEIIITSNDNGIQLPINMFENVAPIEVEGKIFYVITLTDVSDTNRRKLFERVFFHDILNTSGALKGLVSMLKHEVPERLIEDVEFIETAFSGLVNQIQEQRRIIEAENNVLPVDYSELYSNEVLNSVAVLYRNHPVAENKEIIVSADAPNIVFRSDAIILKNVLGNMIKNSLEAIDNHESVVIGCRQIETDYVEFWVHNHTFIPRSVQLQIFKRSFSTKGLGRGIGTYSMKLFGERFLKGTVHFHSDEKNGTTFFLTLQLKEITV